MIIHELVMNFPNFSLRIFQIFFPIFFSKFFCQNFPQNCFGIYFEGFARDTRVLQAPHAGFFSWLYEWENFFPRIFFKFFFKFFFPNFFVKFSSKLFRDLFRGVRARHTRVASTPRGIFLVIIWMRKFFFPEFFPKFFSNFFFQIFLSKFSSKLFWDLFRGVRARHTRVASTPRGIFLVIIWMRKFFFPEFFSRFFPEKFMNYS